MHAPNQGADRCQQRGSSVIGRIALGLLTSCCTTNIVVPTPKFAIPTGGEDGDRGRGNKNRVSFVAAVDGTPASYRALAAALQLAGPGDDVVALHVRHPSATDVPEAGDAVCAESERIMAALSSSRRVGSGGGGSCGGGSSDAHANAHAPSPGTSQCIAVDMQPAGVGETICRYVAGRPQPVHFLALGTTGRSASIMGGAQAPVGTVGLHCLRTSECALIFSQVPGA